METTLDGPPATSSVSRSAASRLMHRANTRHYRVRLAHGMEDVRAAQSLRFAVFNLELNEGLPESYATGLDADEFDPVCDHLLVEDLKTGMVVGTYRLQTGIRAGECHGYYSAREFDFTPFEPARAQIMELGRACVHRQHRNLVVLGLLWNAITRHAVEKKCRYLLGCSSLPTTDAAAGVSVYEDLKKTHLAEEEWRTEPLPALACDPGIAAAQPVKIPKLMSAYFSLGAKICGPPAIDRSFKTIDFLTLMDLHAMPDHLSSTGSTP